MGAKFRCLLSAVVAAVLVVAVAPGASSAEVPFAYNDLVEALGDGTTTLTLNAEDADEDPLTFAVATPPAHGSLGAIGAPSCSAGFCSADVDYTPTTSYRGPDSFTFTVNDGTATSDPGTIDIDVVDAPCSGAIVSNGTVQLGVNCTGNLNVDGGSPSSGEGTTIVGLRYVPTNADSTSPGCLCEGWGVADATSGVTGYANESSGTANVAVQDFTKTDTTATSKVAVGSTFEVTHEYKPSTASSNLYQVNVSVKNVSASAVHLRYRRVMDWDIEPTAFSEFSTVNKGSASEIVFTSNDGFATADPLAGPSDIGFTGNFTDAGPDDHGALFDFDFGTLAAGVTRTFTTFYGAAASESGAAAALSAAGAEAYSFGQPSTTDGPALGTPNTFVFAFAGVGGTPVFAPDAVDDALITTTDTVKSVDVLTNDTDPNGDTLSVTTPSPSAAHGTVSCVSTGLCTYTPTAGYSGIDAFTYGISDGHGGSDTATVNVTVNPAGSNSPPVADDETLTTPEDTPGTVSVLVGDSDPDGDTLTVTGKTDGAHGTVACTAAGSCTYTPAANYHGPDSFTYTVSDGHGGTDTATVNVTVTPVNDSPVADDETLTTPEDTPGTVGVLDGDTDVDGDTLTVTADSDGAHGTVACTAAGSCTYTPAANYHGPDSFTYTVSDGHGGTDTGTVTVTVTPVNDPPVAGGNSLTTAQATPGTVAVLSNDSDVDGDTLTVTGATNGGHGTVACIPAGTCTYTPAAGFSGPDSFSYTVSDGHGGTATATVTVTVTPVTAPAAGDVKIEKIESADPVPVGNAFSYRLVVSTVSSATAKAVTVSDSLPAGFKVASVGTTRGTCVISGGTLSCPLGDMSAGSSATITVHGAFVVAGNITNTARVTATGDPTNTNDQASAITTVTGKTCTIVGTFGNDNPLLGTNKADVICGLGGNDRINGKRGNDTVYGNDGNDRLAGLGGDDTIDGGPGTDTVTYAAAMQSMRVNLGQHKATGQGVDTLLSIENVLGSRHADTLIGSTGPNTLTGGPGADKLNGGKGNDKLNGGKGSDTCSQGKGKGKITSC